MFIRSCFIRRADGVCLYYRGRSSLFTSSSVSRVHGSQRGNLLTPTQLPAPRKVPQLNWDLGQSWRSLGPAARIRRARDHSVHGDDASDVHSPPRRDRSLAHPCESRKSTSTPTLRILTLASSPQVHDSAQTIYRQRHANPSHLSTAKRLSTTCARIQRLQHRRGRRSARRFRGRLVGVDFRPRSSSLQAFESVSMTLDVCGIGW